MFPSRGLSGGLGRRLGSRTRMQHREHLVEDMGTEAPKRSEILHLNQKLYTPNNQI